MGFDCRFWHIFPADVCRGHIRDVPRLPNLEPKNPPFTAEESATNLNLKGDPLLVEVRVFFYMCTQNELTLVTLKV